MPKYDSNKVALATKYIDKVELKLQMWYVLNK